MIRPATPADADQLTALALASKAYWGYSPEFMRSCVDELSVSAEKIGSGKMEYRVHETDAGIQGFYAVELPVTDELESTDSASVDSASIDSSEAWLDALFVHPQHIGSGVGRTLMQHAAELLKHRSVASLKILSDPNAEKFYLASGAVRIGEQESGSIKGRYLPLLLITLAQRE